MTRPRETLKAVEAATGADAVIELQAVLEWSELMGFKNISPRIRWALAVLDKIGVSTMEGKDNG